MTGIAPESMASQTTASNPVVAGRIQGLDLCRGVGMCLVLVAHACMLIPSSVELFNDRITWQLVTVGQFFVEQFFAMSGFLIGGILLRDVLPNPTPKAIVGYAGKRWLRTLPVYYFIIMALLALEFWQTGSIVPRWSYVFFVQNFFNGGEGFLAASWSLAIEQWSYLLLPLVLLLFAPLVQRRFGYSYHKALLLTAIGLIVLFIGVRTVLAMTFISPEIFDKGVRKQIPLRLDAVLYGLLIVQCKLERPDWYRKLGSGWFFLVVAAASFVLMHMQYTDHLLERVPGGVSNFVFHSGLGFALTNMLAALTLPFFDVNPVNRLVDRIPRVRWVILKASQYSYSVYLIHLPILVAMQGLLWHFFPLPPVPALLVSLVCMGVGILVSFGVAALLYHFVEEPCMRLRRFLPR